MRVSRERECRSPARIFDYSFSRVFFFFFFFLLLLLHLRFPRRLFHGYFPVDRILTEFYRTAESASFLTFGNGEIAREWQKRLIEFPAHGKYRQTRSQRVARGAKRTGIEAPGPVFYRF